jgi:4-hydroxy-2-oxoheptanedioate aldolase
MNYNEKDMVAVLTELKQKHHAVAVKMEFEAEGTRLYEACRLKEIATVAGLPLTIKIGGAEAVRDIEDARMIGCKYLVAPMVETAYALKKFIQSAADPFSDTELYVNIETITAVQNLEKMFAIPESKMLEGIVLGRVDMTGSMGLNRDAVNSKELLDLCLSAGILAKKHGKKVVVGGAVSWASAGFFESFGEGRLDKFETRKVVFGCPGALKNGKESYSLAAEFEVLWLENKKEYYGKIYSEDDVRIDMMNTRRGVK